jgi:Uma2 family endonuclease
MAIEARQPALQLTWEDDGTVLSLAPLQGHWTEAQYLLLTAQTNRLIEFTDGTLEALPMPTDRHQVIVRTLFLALFAFLQPRGGTVLFAPLRLRIRPGKFREPDLLLLCDAADPRRQRDYWLGADLVIEVISPDDPERDTVTKRADYAEARVPEYWLVDPAGETITVLTLQGTAYVEHGVFHRGEQAASALLAGFGVGVEAVFDAV